MTATEYHEWSNFDLFSFSEPTKSLAVQVDEDERQQDKV